MKGKAAPAGADLQQAQAGGQSQLAADAVELGDGCLFHGAVRPLEDAAGVGHGRVEEEPVKIVAQVVVSGDVPATAAPAVVVQAVHQPLERRGQPGQATFQLRLRFPVAHHDPHQGRQVVAVPQAIQVGFAGADGAATSHLAIKGRAVHPDDSREICPGVPEFLPLTLVEQNKSTRADCRKGFQEQAAGQPVQQAGGSFEAPRHGGTGLLFTPHGWYIPFLTSRCSGCGQNGTPLIFSRSACQ